MEDYAIIIIMIIIIMIIVIGIMALSMHLLMSDLPRSDVCLTSAFSVVLVLEFVLAEGPHGRLITIRRTVVA